MTPKLRQQLSEAKTHFYALRLPEAYTIFRRYFDRLPFQVDPEHGEYVGMFIRTLVELGKDSELKFYVPALEKHVAVHRSAPVLYALGCVYWNLPQAQSEHARKLLEEVVGLPDAGDYATKAKMVLASYYDRKLEDTAACRRLIESIPPPEDRSLNLLWLIWKAKILKDEKRFDLAQTLIDEVFEETTIESDWYAFYCAKVIQAYLHLERGDMGLAKEVLEEVRGLFEGKRLKSLGKLLGALESQIQKRSEVGALTWLPGPKGSRCGYQNRELTLRVGTPAEKLLSLIISEGYLKKARIVEHLYGRAYEGVADDKLIYYHVHSLRRKLATIGIPPGVISTEKDGYRLAVEVEPVDAVD